MPTVESNRALPRCCDACWHSPARPCPDVVACLTGGESCHSGCDGKRQNRVQSVRQQNTKQPVIFLGMGTCGLGAGAGKTLAAIKTYLGKTGKQATVIEVGCLGLCSHEPLLDVQFPGQPRVAFMDLTEEKVPALLDKVFDGELPEAGVLGQHRDPNFPVLEKVPFIDEHAFFRGQTRWVLANCGIVDPQSLEEYMVRGGYRALTKTLKSHTPDDTCDLIEKSGLRGRGGGGFPSGKKWKLARQVPADQRYLVCNADEGDPGAFMDRSVIESDPYRLLEGMAIAAYAVGASQGIIYIRAEYPLAIERLLSTIPLAKAAGLLGRNILGSGFDFEVSIKQGAGAFVCGEETALMHSIEGRRGMPRVRPPYPSVKGLWGKPTCINNVETLANLPGILQNGVDWFTSVGTAGSKGTKVFALSGKVARTGLVEVAMGTSMRDVVFGAGGGIANGKAYKAVQIGGPSGGCIPQQHLDILVDYESLKKVGAMMGSGGLVVMDEDNCMVDVAKFFMDFIQRESCGKCIPCREGTRRMLEILNAITRGYRNENDHQTAERFKGIMALEELAEVIGDTSLCGLGQTAPNPVLSTLRWFREEYEAHIFERKCAAHVCVELLNYTIDNEKCTGCTVCTKQCPTSAIMGEKKTAHYIMQDKCIACGTCAEVCKFDAVSAD
jgi:NADH:ubiquinone oxidoreductase subunit F (NADH-binding)/Pyruvate/2-oxoacid:ferredoxin oxidoreductase delta subunit